jgi:hypothetical protein
VYSSLFSCCKALKDGTCKKLGLQNTSILTLSLHGAAGIYDTSHSPIFTIINEDWDGGDNQMGRTIPSFRIVLAMEKEDWKPFRNALDKSDRKKFDGMFDIPKLYISACFLHLKHDRTAFQTEQQQQQP